MGEILYLIKSKKDGTYLQKNLVSERIYSSDIGTAILNKFPWNISKEGNFDINIFSSEDPQFYEILQEEYSKLLTQIDILNAKDFGLDVLDKEVQKLSPKEAYIELACKIINKNLIYKVLNLAKR